MNYNIIKCYYCSDSHSVVKVLKLTHTKQSEISCQCWSWDV